MPTGGGVLAGIGFTMALFIAGLALLVGLPRRPAAEPAARSRS
jgi:Na+/H+ antiporter NhaA